MKSADFLGDNLTRSETSWNICYAFCKILSSEKHLNFYGCTRYSFKKRERTNALKASFYGKNLFVNEKIIYSKCCF